MGDKFDKLQQAGSMFDYINDFRTLVSILPHINEHPRTNHRRLPYRQRLNFAVPPLLGGAAQTCASDIQLLTVEVRR